MSLRITIFLLLLCLPLATTSCRMPDTFGFYQPITLSTAVPDGPPEYKAGWYAGCKSGLAARHSSSFANAWVYQEGKGPEFGSGVYQHDPAYQTGWGQGWFSCAIHSSTFTSINSTKFGPLE
jgi:hypothetical protein